MERAGGPPTCWATPDGVIELAADDVHVWRAQLDAGPCPSAQEVAALVAGLLGVLGHYRHDEAGPAAGAQSLRFSISCSAAVALVAVTRGRALGIHVDAVCRRVDLEQVAAHFFTRLENEHLAALAGPARQVAFFALWTAKEAFVKATGEPPVCALEHSDVTLRPGPPLELTALRGRPEEAALWSLRSIDAGAGHVAALAVNGRIASVATWQWVA